MGQGGGGIARRLEVVLVVALLAAPCVETAQRGGSPTDACTDTNPVECGIWAKDGQCKSNANYMGKNCKLSCHVCHAAPTPASSSRSSALPALTVSPLSTPRALTTGAYVVPTTTLPIPVVPTQFHFVATTNQICSGSAYTDSKAVGCNGWQGLDVVQCQQKCGESAHAPNCPRKRCLAAAFFSSSGWCHLFEAQQCRSLISEQFVTTLMKTEESIFDNPVLSRVKETMETPVAQDIMKGTAVAAAVGVAAAGVEAALATRDTARSSTIAPPGGDGLFLDSPSTTNMLDGVPPPPSFRNRDAASSQTTTSAAATGGNSLSAPGGSFGSLPLWLPLVVVCCCCLSAAVTAVAFKSREKFLSRHSSYSRDFEEEDEDYVSDGQD